MLGNATTQILFVYLLVSVFVNLLLYRKIMCLNKHLRKKCLHKNVYVPMQHLLCCSEFESAIY